MVIPPPSSYQIPRSSYTERDYEEIYYHFDDYAAEILLSHATDLMLDREHDEHYHAEDVILDEASQYEWESMKKSALFGLGCGAIGFGLLRWRRGGGMGRYASRSSGGYRFDPIDKQTSMNYTSFQQTNNFNTPKSGILLHTTLSTLLGLGVTLFAIETDLFYPATYTDGQNDMILPPPQWISPQIPLVPGRSMVSDLLCKPLTDEFRKFPKQLWQSGNFYGFENGYNNHIALYANGGWKDSKYYNSNPNASVVSLGENSGKAKLGDKKGVYEQLLLDSLQGFIINCERRSRYEQKLRRISGASRDKPVIIPKDGVPADEDLELDDVYFVQNEDDREEFGL